MIGQRLPDHRSIARVLADLPEIADWVEKRGRNSKGVNCWGDMLFEAQKLFPSRRIAAAIRRLELCGWGRLVVLTWCPWDEELDVLWTETRSILLDRGGILSWRLIRRRLLYGAFGEVRQRWTIVREEWIRRVGLTGEEDPRFLRHVIDWLEAGGKAASGLGG